MSYLVFSIDNQEFGVSIDHVIRVIWSVFVTPVNETSDSLLGMVNVENEVIPVIDIRNVLGLNQKELDLTDQFIICEFPTSKAVLWVDRVLEIDNVETEEDRHHAPLASNLTKMTTVLKKESKLISVYDWESFISQPSYSKGEV